MVITISREFGSNGHEVGRLLAERLGYKFCDQDMISIAARESGYDEELFKKIDEQRTTSFLFSLAMGVFPYTSKMSSTENLSLTDKLYEIQKKVIIGLAEAGDCVIVGRCSNFVLRGRVEGINVFVGANMDDRVKTVAERENINEEKARNLINMMDKKRSSYYNYYTGEKWGHRQNYDLCVNVSKAGVENTVRLICEMAELSTKG